MIVITVARKPLDGTVIQTVARWGTGALNIDASRVTTSGETFATPQAQLKNRTGGDRDLEFWTRSSEGQFRQAQRDSIERTRTLGRWPSNLILSHAKDCTCRGLRKVKSHNARLVNTVTGTSTWNIGAAGYRREAPGIYGHADNEGMETVQDWHCSPSCPVPELDEQSGILRSAPVDRPQNRDTQKGGSGVCFVLPGQSPGYGDVGGASRYFRQVKE